MKTTAKIPTELWKDVKKECVEEGIDLADAINSGLSLWLASKRSSKSKQAMVSVK